MILKSTTSKKNETLSIASHVAMYMMFSQMFEMKSPRAVLNVVDWNEVVAIAHYKGITEEQQRKLEQLALDDRGKRYGYLKLILFLIREIITKRYNLTWNWITNIDVTHKYVCSQVIAQYYDTVLGCFPEWKSLDPDTMLDMLMEDDRWKVTMLRKKVA